MEGKISCYKLYKKYKSEGWGRDKFKEELLRNGHLMCSTCKGEGKHGAASQSLRGYVLWYCDCKKGKEVEKLEKENKGGNIYWKDKFKS